MLALVLGAVMTLGFAPFSWWFVVPVALTLYLGLLKHSDRPFRLGWCFGLGWFGAGISWVHVSIAEFGGLPLVGSLALMLLLCGYLALFPALTSYLCKRYIPLVLWPLAVPAAWFVSEWIRSWLLSGFPWLSLGYSQLSGPLNGWFPLVGETGVSLLLVLLATSLACWLPARRYLASALLSSVILLGGWTIRDYPWVSPQDEPVSMAMVQGNIKQELRWVPEQDRPTMEKYLALTKDNLDHQVIIWPEAAVPKLEPVAAEYLAYLDELSNEHHTAIITGIVNYNFETRAAFNTLLALGKREPDDDQGHYNYLHGNRYAKHHLLPIGEFIPFEDWLRGLAPIFDLPMSSFSRGDFQQRNLIANGIHFAPAICFEIVFPHQIRANLYSDTDFIITVSNDAWFGRSHGPDQHMEIAQIRAREFGIPVVRATNTGITAFVDHRGEIQSQLPQFEAAVLSDKLFPVTGTTPYRRFGDAPVWALVLVILLFTGIRIRSAQVSR